MHRVKGIYLAGLLIIGLIFTGLISACTERSLPLELFSRTQIMMGDIPVTIRLLAPAGGSDKAFQAMGAAFALARDIAAQVSEFEATSETSALNNASGSWQAIGDHLAALFRQARAISAQSDGAFDITFASQRAGANYQDVQLSPDGQQARLIGAGTRIGLSGIAKGYIVDQMARYLSQAGWRNFLINAGGDLRAVGHGPDGPWSVTLPWPGRDTRCELQLLDRSLASSGLSERGAHITDPKRRRPAEGRWSQVTVLAPDTASADAFATAAFVAGPDAVAEMEPIRVHTSKIFIFFFRPDGVIVPIGAPGLLPEISCLSSDGDSKTETMPDIPL